jgi:hypothetical protein
MAKVGKPRQSFLSTVFFHASIPLRTIATLRPVFRPQRLARAAAMLRACGRGPERAKDLDLQPFGEFAILLDASDSVGGA